MNVSFIIKIISYKLFMHSSCHQINDNILILYWMIKFQYHWSIRIYFITVDKILHYYITVIFLIFLSLSNYYQTRVGLNRANIGMFWHLFDMLYSCFFSWDNFSIHFIYGQKQGHKNYYKKNQINRNFLIVLFKTNRLIWLL